MHATREKRNSRSDLKQQALCHLRIYVEAGNNAEQNQRPLTKVGELRGMPPILNMLQYSAVIENMLIFFAIQR
jgi:hypothetical protein